MSPLYLFVFISLCAVNVWGDCYLQYPPGNNDRLDEEGDRTDENRLFDSQNNAAGGYCWGPEVTWYEGSVLPVEWTVQHSCGNTNTQCQLILQYMCSSDAPGDDESLIIRDGTTTNEIPTGSDPAGANYYNTKNTDGTFTFGMNEPLSNYQSCVTRERNKGLFYADQQISNNQGAMATRQNPGGTRYGFECTEERDYYPYWHPSPWKDVAVMVDSKSQCGYYQAESQNVKDKYYCTGNAAAQKVNNQAACTVAGGQWVAQKAWGIGKPDCFEAQWSRDNHLGNGVSAHTLGYNWTLPRASQESCINHGNCTCVMRLRYNITVGELNGKEDYLQSGVHSVIKEDPTVLAAGANYTLAINTAQTGRTFQDRTYMWRLTKRPAGIPQHVRIHNVGVRGKRGNIVETYPATEYDFVPTFLDMEQHEYVHFQWTGCDTNPRNNAGEGRDQTDRSNIVQIADMTKNLPLNDTQLQHVNVLFKDPKVRYRMAMIDQVNCLSYDELKAAETATGTAVDQNPQNCMILNQAGPLFTGELVRMDDPHTYYYMSTRNNNFSNRSQKASIRVHPAWKAWMTAVVVVGGVVAVAAGASFGAIFYAKRHPMSTIAQKLRFVPGLGHRI